MAYSILDSVFISDERNIVSAGIITALTVNADNIGINTDLTVGGNLNVTGIATIGGVQIGDSGGGSPDLDNITNLNLSGVLTAPTAALGIATVFDLTVYNQLLDSNEAVGAAGSILAIEGGKLVWTSPEAAGIATAFKPGSTFFVAENGDDTNDGLSASTPFKTITYALSQISPATYDSLVIGAGDYEETFPLEVPNGVTIKGAGQRATLVRPSAATATEDGFKLGNACTVEDLSIGDMQKPAGSNSYAFSYRVGAAITTRSPYVSRVTVLNRGSITNADDPYGFNSPDNQPVSYRGAGGFNIDGSLVDQSSLEAGFLLNEVTAFVPNNEGIRMTNGARAEVLNTFVYFAADGIIAEADTTVGFASTGRTRLTLDSPSSPVQVDDVVEYYDTDGTTVLASGTVNQVVSNYVYLDDAGTGEFVVPRDRTAVAVNFVGTAEISTAQARFGASSLNVTGATTDVATAEGVGFGFEGGDFTVEGWFYFDSLASGDTLIDFRNSTAGEGRLSVEVGAVNSLDVSIAGTPVLNGGTLTTGSWIHISVARAAGTLRAFIDGTQVDSAANATNLGTTGTLHLGADFSDANGVDAYVDDFRVIKGAAKYTGTFTPPTTTLKSDKDTSILLHFEGSDGDTTTTDDVAVFQDIRFGAGETADKVTLADYSQFGADLRCVGSAVEYGTRGVTGDGQGVTLRLISINFNHVGADGDITNDPTKAIQVNEVTELNSAEVSYVSIDQKGDFRVGEAFFVDQETGTVSFQDTVTDLTALSSLTISDGTNSSLITPTSGRFGNIQISSNQIESTTGDVDIVTAGAGEFNVYGNTNIIGVLTAASVALNAIQNGDTSIALDDTGADGTIRFNTDGTEAGRFDNNNDLTVTNDINVGNDLSVTGRMTSAEASIGVATITSLTVGTLTGGSGGGGGGGGTEITEDTVVTKDLVAAGVATIGTLGVTTDLTVGRNLDVVGLSTFGGFLTGAGATFSQTLGVDGHMYVGGNLNVVGRQDVDEFFATNMFIIGIGTFGTVDTDILSYNIGVGTTAAIEDLAFGVGIGSTAAIEDLTFTDGTFTNLTGLTTAQVAGGSTISATFGRFEEISVQNFEVSVDGLDFEFAQATNVLVTGIATHNLIKYNQGIGTFQSVTGILTAADLQVTGFSTFSNAVDITTDIRVGGAATVTGDLSVTGNLNVTGDISYDEVSGRNLNISGIATLNQLEVTTDALVSGNLDVTGHTETDTLNVSGVSTFVGVATFKGDVHIDGNLIIDGDNSQDLVDTTNLNVTGITTLNVLDVNGDSNIGGIATFSSTHVDFENTVAIAGVATASLDLSVGRNLVVAGIATANEYDSLSDVRLKRNIRGVDNALNRLREVSGVEYTWKESGERTMGVIAQVVEEVFPELVKGNETLSVNYNGLVAVLIESVKELKMRVEELEEKLES